MHLDAAGARGRVIIRRPGGRAAAGGLGWYQVVLLILLALFALPGAARGGPPEGDQGIEPGDSHAGSAQPDPTDSHVRPVHASLGAGGFAALGGPSSHGLAATFEIYPGRGLGPYGAALYWRGFYGDGRTGLQHGMIAAGVTFEAGAARPTLTLAMHGEAGWAYGDSLPVLGGGVRTQLAFWPPLAVAFDLTGHLFLDGVDTSLALAGVITVGATR